MASFASVNDNGADQEEVVPKKPTYKSFKFVWMLRLAGEVANYQAGRSI